MISRWIIPFFSHEKKKLSLGYGLEFLFFYEGKMMYLYIYHREEGKNEEVTSSGSLIGQIINFSIWSQT